MHNQNEHERTEEPGSGMIAIFLLFGLFIILPDLVNGLLFSTGTLDSELDLTTRHLISALIAIPPILWLGVYVANASWRECYPLRTFSVLLIAPIIVVSAAGSLVLLEVLTWLPISNTVTDSFAEAFSGNYLSTVLIVVVVAPVFEELFFRGWMLRSFLQRHSARKSILFSAVLFAIFHMDPWYALTIFPLGLFFAWLTFKTGSLLPSMLSHTVVNTKSFFLTHILILTGYDLEKVKQTGHFPALLLVLAIILTVVGGLFLYWLVSKRPDAQGSRS